MLGGGASTCVLEEHTPPFSCLLWRWRQCASPKRWDPTSRRLDVTSQKTKLLYVYFSVSDLSVASFFLHSLKLITFAYELTQPNNIHESRRMLCCLVLTHTCRCVFTMTCANVAGGAWIFRRSRRNGWAAAERPDSWGRGCWSLHDQVIVCSPHYRYDITQPSVAWVAASLSEGTRWTECVSDHSSLSIAELKNA